MLVKIYFYTFLQFISPADCTHLIHSLQKYCEPGLWYHLCSQHGALTSPPTDRHKGIETPTAVTELKWSIYCNISQRGKNICIPFDQQ